MFGSNNQMTPAFGQSSTSPFGSPSVFGQNSATNNPFAPKPFSSPNPFGSQTGASIFGGTSTGVFGASQSSSPFSSTTTFGASSSPSFGSSTSAFGASSTPAFGSSSSPFGGSSGFGQKPSYGSFGSTSTQTSPFGNTNQQSQPSFGSSIFGSSTPFGAPSQPAFGAAGSPAFGAMSMPAFGATSTPSFGATSTPTFGSTTSPAFGATNTAFGASSAPVFGSSSTPAFGASSTPLFGSSSTPAFGASSTPSFGTPSTSAFGASSTPSFSFGSTPAFGQSTSAFGSSSFGAGSSPFGAQGSAFGLQSTTPAFATSSVSQSGFGGQRGGSRVTAYTPTTESDAGQAGGQAGKLESVSAMPVYKDKSHEELRWEDYQLGDKGGPTPAQAAGAVGFGSTTHPSLFGSPSTFGQSSASPFSSSMTSNLFGQKPSTFGPGFGANSGSTFASSGFGSSFSTTPSLISSSTSAFGPTSSALNFGSSSSLFSSSQAPGTSSPFGSSFNTTQPSQLFNSTGSQIGQNAPAFGQTTSLFGQSTAPTFNQTNPFSTTSSFGGNMFTGNTSLFGQSTPSLSTPFQPTTTQTSSSFGFGNFGLSQPFGAGSSSGAPGMFSQSNMGLQPATLSSAVMQPVPVTNPFGTLPAMPQISIGQGGTEPSIQYGISSMPVLDKPAPVRISSLLTSRHLSQSRTKFPARKYYPKSDVLKVPFFTDDEDTTTTPKADALFIPRENPRALVISPMEPMSAKASEKVSSLMGRSNANGNVRELKGAPTTKSNTEKRDQDLLKRAGTMGQVQPIHEVNLTSNGHKEDQSPPKGDSYMTLSGHRAGEAAIVYEHGADIEALMPKLRRSDYFTEPRIQELAAKERADPGFCRHVKDFIVGRHGFGSIIFLGETDVRRLDIESLVEFNNREVIVYMDDSKKPPVGQGLNKPAEVTLLNIKCFDKKTGHQYTEGPKIEKYKEMLKKKAEDQGAEFISYDPIKGEWKFRVSHFSSYSFSDGDD